MNKLLASLSEEEQLEESVRNIAQTVKAELKKDRCYMHPGYQKGSKLGYKLCDYALDRLISTKKINRDTVKKVAGLLDDCFCRSLVAETKVDMEWLVEYHTGKTSAFLHTKHKLENLLEGVKLNGECKEEVS